MDIEIHASLCEIKGRGVDLEFLLIVVPSLTVEEPLEGEFFFEDFDLPSFLVDRNTDGSQPPLSILYLEEKGLIIGKEFRKRLKDGYRFVAFEDDGKEPPEEDKYEKKRDQGEGIGNSFCLSHKTLSI